MWWLGVWDSRDKSRRCFYMITRRGLGECWTKSGAVCDLCMITVWLRGNPLGRESEGLNAQVWWHCMSNMLLFAFKELCRNRRWLHKVNILCLHWIWSVVYFQHSFMMPCHAWIDYAMIDDMLWFAIAILGTCLIRHDSIMLVDAMMLFRLNYL